LHVQETSVYEVVTLYQRRLPEQRQNAQVEYSFKKSISVFLNIYFDCIWTLSNLELLFTVPSTFLL